MAVNLNGPLTALQVMQDAPVIPVIVLSDVAHAVPMARALVAGGIRMLEVTLRTPQALACMEAIAKEVPGAVVGAGTVRSPADAAAAAKAGARFAVSPGYTKLVGQACRDNGLSLLPGVATGSEIMMAQEDGYTELKFFPAMQAGGPAMLTPPFKHYQEIGSMGKKAVKYIPVVGRAIYDRYLGGNEALARQAAKVEREERLSPMERRERKAKRAAK